MNRPLLLLAVVVLAGAAGCSGSQNATMSDQERANFSGGGATASRSPQQQAAMNDFISEFNKKHPPHGGGPAGAPTVAPPR